MMRNIVQAARTVGEDISDFVQSRVRPSDQSLTSHEKACVADLRRDGFAVVKEYWPREKALQMRDHLESYLVNGNNQDFENGSYLRFWNDRNQDKNVRRIYHAERLIDELKRFRSDIFVFGIATAYCGAPIYSGVLVYQHNTQSDSNTRYYHVDAFSKQFKAFLYLDDVDDGNGPFTYLRGSHRCYWVRLKKQIVGNREAPPTSFYDKDLRAMLKHEVEICGPAGTLILADVRGLHRGSPQVNRSRSVLVNYMYTSPGDKYFDR